MTGTNTEWVERQTGIILTEGQSRCLETLCSIDRVYNVVHSLAGGTLAEQLKFDRHFLLVRYKSELATFDFDKLTRLVKAAHDNCVRVSIRPFSRFSMEIMLHERTPGSSRAMERHPKWQEVA